MLSAFCVGSVEEIEKETSEKIEPSCGFIFRHAIDQIGDVLMNSYLEYLVTYTLPFKSLVFFLKRKKSVLLNFP